MNTRHIDNYKSLDQIDTEMTAQIRAFVRQERRETFKRHATVGLMALLVAFLWWLATENGHAFMVWIDAR